MPHSVPPLRWLDAATVRAAMPPLPERLELAERILMTLASPGSAELPPKIGVHPRPEGSFAHAMPAHLRGATPGGDLLGMKWVTGAGAARRPGSPAISALVVLNDAQTGEPAAILDGGPITAERTAAVSGIAIRLFAPQLDRPARAAIIGAGVQGRSHLEVLGHLLPGVEVRIHDRHPDRSAVLADDAAGVAGIGLAEPASTARDAVEDADVVITAASFTTPDQRQAMTPDWLAPGALVVAVDYATVCSAAVARDARRFVVDERRQFMAAREAGQFEGYPDPDAILGETLLAGPGRPASAARVLVTHLGVGLADLVFASAIVRRVEAEGLGVTLDR